VPVLITKVLTFTRSGPGVLEVPYPPSRTVRVPQFYETSLVWHASTRAAVTWREFELANVAVPTDPSGASEWWWLSKKFVHHTERGSYIVVPVYLERG
jgi:hypothetical protein